MCSLRILVSLVSRFRYLSVFVWFGYSTEELWRSLGGRFIASFGGSPMVADRPKVEGSSLKSKVLRTSICGNWKERIFYCINQTTCIFLLLSITNDFIIWVWPCGVGVDRTTLKMLCVIYFIVFTLLLADHVFHIYLFNHIMLQHISLLQQAETC